MILVLGSSAMHLMGQGLVLGDRFHKGQDWTVQPGASPQPAWYIPQEPRISSNWQNATGSSGELVPVVVPNPTLYGANPVLLLSVSHPKLAAAS